MSFASEVKEEVARLELDDKSRKAELSALVKLLSSVSFTSSGMKLTLRTKNAVVIRMISQDFSYFYDIKPQLQVVKDERLTKSNTYMVVITEKVRDILQDLDLWTESGLQTHPRMKFLANENMIRGYLAGCFLATGSVNSPNITNYHLEVSTSEEEHSKFIVRLLEKFYINARITERRNQFVVYIKASEQITDFLKVIGASDAVFTFEDVRIQRDFMNNFSRLNNCQIANDAKSMETANRQYEAVKYLIDNDLMYGLSKKDQEMARLRFDNPEASLAELAEIYEETYGGEISKSGVRHRFNKIMAKVEEYRKSLE